MDGKFSAKLLQNIDYFYAKDSNSVISRDPLLEDRFNEQLGEQSSLTLGQDLSWFVCFKLINSKSPIHD